MKLLIIGSKGFIGSHAVRYFSDKFEIYECDVVVDYTTSNYRVIDASDADFKVVFEKKKYDFCLNCSGAASVPDSIIHPLRDFYLNTVNVFRILDAIRLYNPECKFINLSSAAVYGNPTELPIKENAVLNPISPYGKHKLMSEQICQEFTSGFGLKTCSLRIFSAYGEGLKKQLFWDLHTKMKQSQSINLFGTGEESRDYIYIKDIIKIIELVMFNSTFLSDCINVANGEKVKIKDVINIYAKAYQWNGKVNFSGDVRKGDPIDWKADISQVKTLGYEQSTSISKGLEQYIDWLKAGIL